MALAITLTPWGERDLPVLERANTPEMTAHLGGPESPEELAQRHARYLRLNATGEAKMFRIDVDGAPVGGIGYWQIEHDGTPAFETGWSVEPGWQGRGVASEALRLLIRVVADDGRRNLLVAYPGVENGASNALCDAAGFERTGSDTMMWRGSDFAFNVWVLDMSPLD